MDTQRGQGARNAVISGQNEHNGRCYRASIVWGRKWIGAEEESLVPGRMEIERYEVFAEAWIWRGGWFNLWFWPLLVMSYRPTEPTDPHPENFLKLTLQTITECDLAEVAGGEVNGQLQRFCAPYRIWPIFGYRRHILTLRRVPHIQLFGWPEGRPLPQSASVCQV
jgi:hypothetical protein